MQPDPIKELASRGRDRRNPGLRALDERIEQQREVQKLSIDEKLRMNEDQERNPFRSGQQSLWTPGNVFFLVAGLILFVRVLDYLMVKILVKEFPGYMQQMMQGMRGLF